MSDLSPEQIAELVYQYERVLAQIDRGSLMLSPRLLKRVKDTITALAQVKELEAIPRDEADGFNKIIAYYQQQAEDSAFDIEEVYKPQIEKLQALLNEYKDAECRAVKSEAEALFKVEDLEAANKKALEYLQREGTPYVNSAIAALQENDDDNESM